MPGALEREAVCPREQQPMVHRALVTAVNIAHALREFGTDTEQQTAAHTPTHLYDNVSALPARATANTPSGRLRSASRRATGDMGPTNQGDEAAARSRNAVAMWCGCAKRVGVRRAVWGRTRCL